MRRRTKLGIALVILAALFVTFLVTQDDGLGWVRKYGGREGRSISGTAKLDFRSGALAGEFHTSVVEFQFREIPPELLAEIKRRGARHWSFGSWTNYELPSVRQTVYVKPDRGVVEISRFYRYSWIQEKWAALMERLGFSK